MSKAEWIACASPEKRQAFLDSLEDNSIAALPYLFDFWAMEHQRPPEGDWRTWLVMGGRGAGKTRAGAEWVRSMVEGARPRDAGRARRVALVGETIDQVREVMVFGDSGLMSVSPPDRMPKWIAGRRMLEWPNGAIAQVFSAHEPENLRGPQFGLAWSDEFGCPAVDKGPNQPNKFVDPKSGESGLPYFSNGQRDDLAQYQYYAAMYDFWSDPANNPVSGEYGGPMVDMARACAWAWDARPYPAFPQNEAVWSDGENYQLGHWLNGRASARSLAGVVEEVCRDAGLEDLDSRQLFGIVRGYSGGDAGSARGMLQPLMLTYGFDAFERDGLVCFANRNGQASVALDPAGLAVTAESDADIERLRGASSEQLDAVRLGYLDADADMAVQFAASRHPGSGAGNEGSHMSNVVLTSREAKQVAARWLVEARVSRDRVKLALPPSMLAVGPGDVVTPDAGGTDETYRIDRTLFGDSQMLEMVRVEPEIYIPQDAEDEPVRPAQFVAPVPVGHYIMDLPLLRGDELAHAPHFAATSEPWPGGAAVYRSVSSGTFSHLATIDRPAIIGVTETVLYDAPAGRVDRGPVLRVKLVSGALSSVTDDALLLGANRAAIGDGAGENWEVFQFRDAVLVAPDTYEISYRLRGQAGTDALGQGDWPSGSVLVVLDDAVDQVDTGLAMRGLAQVFRVGPSTRPVFDPSFQEQSRAISGIGLRPLAPVHLRAVKDASGDISVSWVRRSRIDADNWASMDVPLGEDNENYLVRIYGPGLQVLREITASQQGWTYTAADQAADGASGVLSIEVAQLSAQFGPGLFRKVQINV